MILISCSNEPYPPVDWKEKYDILYLSYLDIKDERDANKELLNLANQDIKDLQIKNATLSLMYGHLKEEYKTALRYIDLAEYIFRNAEMDFNYLGMREDELEEWEKESLQK